MPRPTAFPVPRCGAQAHGTADTPGFCTDKWPTGFAYKARGLEFWLLELKTSTKVI